MNYNNNICQKNDMKYLEESYNNAIILNFEKNNLSNGCININYNNSISINGLITYDNYMFKFEITPLIRNNYKFIKIEVGFKIEYKNNNDINLIIDENNINKENLSFKIGSLCESLELKKKINNFEKDEHCIRDNKY